MPTARSEGFISVTWLREALVDRLLPLLTVCMWVFAAASLARLGVTGFRPFMVVQAAVVCGTTAAWLFRARLSVGQRGLAIVIVLALLFLTGVLTFGLLSAALILPPVISLFLAAMGYGRMSMASVWIATCILLIAGALFVTDVLRPLVDPVVYAVAPAAWLIWIVAVGGVSVVFAIPLRLIPEALDARDRRYRTLFDSASDAIFLMSDGMFVDCNRRALELFGAPAEGLVNHTPEEFSPPLQPDGTDSASKAEALIRAALGGTPQRFEWRHRRADGTEFDADVALNRLDFAPGSPDLLAIVRDITEWKAGEEALRLSESRYRALVENTPDIIARFDPECRYLFINGAVRGVSPFTPDQFVGKRPADVGFSAAQAAEREALIYRVFATGRPVEAELTFTAGGHMQIYEWRAFPEFDPAGAVRSVIAVNRDITMRKEAERDLTASMEQLHALARRMETVREEERKAVSHEVHDELGQILTALRMDLMGLRGTGPGGGIAYGEKVKSMLDLTDQAIASVQGIAARLRPGMLDYLGLPAAMEWQAEEFQKRSGVRVTIDLPPEEPALDGEIATALFRILQEALTNVARHARADAVAIMLSRSADGVTMTVTDNGAGIPPGKVGDPASLGLMGMRERLHPFGGTCTIESPPGGGTRVAVRIPLPPA